MSTTLMAIIIASVLATIVIIVTGLKRKKEKEENALTPHICFGTKIFLRKKDIPKFERASREEKRRQIGHFRSQVRKGHLIRVMKDGEIVGYTKKQNV